MIAYKLVKQRKDNTTGSLFINRRYVFPFNKWLQAEDHKTKGYAHRPGWHTLYWPIAPHLSKKDRVWIRVEINDYEEFERPESQGGKWLLAQQMRVLEICQT